MAIKFYKLRDERPSGRTYMVRVDRIIAVSDVTAANGLWQFHVMVDCGVEQSAYWCTSHNIHAVTKWHTDLMDMLNGDGG